MFKSLYRWPRRDGWSSPAASLKMKRSSTSATRSPIGRFNSDVRSGRRRAAQPPLPLAHSKSFNSTRFQLGGIANHCTLASGHCLHVQDLSTSDATESKTVLVGWACDQARRACFVWRQTTLSTRQKDSGRVPSKSATESVATKALSSRLRDNPDLKRVDAKNWCAAAGYQLSARGFQSRVWPGARKLAGLPAIGSPGRKRKKS